MQNFEQNLRRIQSKYSHIPSLKGKQASRNVFILCWLAAKGEQSCWDLALEYIKTFRAQDYSEWCKDPHAKAIIYHARQKENTALYRSLDLLMRKHYVKKNGSKYSLTVKGVLLAFTLNPETLKNRIPEILKNPDNEIQAALESVHFPAIPNIEALSQFRKFLKKLHEDPLVRKMFKSMAEVSLQHILLDYKINIDEISEKELTNLFYSEIMKQLSKYLKEKQSSG